MAFLSEWLLALVLLITSVYYFVSLKLNYWTKRKVAGPRPLPFFGNFASVIFGTSSTPDCFSKLYNKWKKYPFLGVYEGHTPMIIINNLDLIKTILIKDFNTFAGRGIVIHEHLDPLSVHLFNLDGPRWKYWRTKLTPVFTTGKLKHMLELMQECADHFENYLRDHIGNGKTVEFREIAAKFTTDVIGSCAFGISMNALSTEDSEFRNIGKKVFQSSHWTVLKRMLRATVPKLFSTLRIKFVSDDITEFFTSTMRETIEYRKKNNYVRHDLVDTLIDIRNKHDNKDFECTDSMLAAQAFVFFLAGFETSSTAISFALYELAYAPKIQEKLSDEISRTLKEHGEKLSYDVINEMKYLEMVVQETLRKNPPGTSLLRQVFQRYTIPDTNVTLEPGTKVVIPTYAIHHDAEYYPNPEVFDPERFSDENKHQRHPMSFLPFGDGPKNCIGSRFAAYQVKLGLIKVLKNYRIEPSPLSPFPYTIDNGAIILAPKGGMYLKVIPISQNL